MVEKFAQALICPYELGCFPYQPIFDLSRLVSAAILGYQTSHKPNESAFENVMNY